MTQPRYRPIYMVRLASLILSLFLFFGVFVFDSKGASRGASKGSAPVHVRGYTTKSGTYVDPHYRSAPDGNFGNNWSTKGNVNPYSGEPGTKTTPSLSYPTRRIEGSGSDVPNFTSTTKDKSSVEPFLAPRTPLLPEIKVGSYQYSQQRADPKRAEYWKELGLNFDPKHTPSPAMDPKVEGSVKDTERARYWKELEFDLPRSAPLLPQ